MTRRLEICPRCGVKRYSPEDKMCLDEVCGYPGLKLIDRIKNLELDVASLKLEMKQSKLKQ
jgi:hypothetical protein